MPHMQPFLLVASQKRQRGPNKAMKAFIQNPKLKSPFESECYSKSRSLFLGITLALSVDKHASSTNLDKHASSANQRCIYPGNPT